MRREDHIIHRQDGVVVARRLNLQHVQAGIGKPALAQRLDQRILIHRRATAGVDEDRALLHLPEMLFLQQMCAFRPCRRVHAHEIGLAHHLVQGGRHHAVFGDLRLVQERVIGDHPQAKGRSAAGHGARHTAEADKTQRLAHQARDFQQRRAAFLPAVFAHHTVLFDDAAEGAEQQRHGMVGHLLDEGVGHVGHRDARGGGGLHIHAVHAHRTQADHLAVHQRGDDLGGDGNALGVDRIRRGGGGDKAGSVHRRLNELDIHIGERLHLQRVIVAADGKAGPGRGDDALFCHAFLQCAVGPKPSMQGRPPQPWGEQVHSMPKTSIF